MIRKAIRTLGAAILVMGLMGTAAQAQQTSSDSQAPAPVIKPVPALHTSKPMASKPMASKPMASKPMAEPKAEEKSELAATASLDYPPCSKTVKDRCIQLWQPDLAKAYPKCAKVKASAARAACIESAYQQDKK
jgi:hypothetical protein